MAVKIRPIRKPQTASYEHSEKYVALQYEVVLSLREAVRQAELLTVDSKSSQPINKQCGARSAN
jgi:hypothetical protein